MFSSSLSEEALPSLMLCFTHLATSSQLFPVLSTAVGQAPCIYTHSAQAFQRWPRCRVFNKNKHPL